MMIWKGELQQLKKYLVSDGIDFKSELTNYLQQGITAFAFAMRTLDEEDADLLIKQINEYQNVKSDSHDKVAEELLSLAQDLILLGILGVVT